MNHRKHRFFQILPFLFFTVFLLNAGLLARELAACRQQQKAFDQLAARFPPLVPGSSSAISSPAASRENASVPDFSTPDAPLLPETASPARWKAWWEKQAESRFPVYQALLQENPHMAGWIHIENTSIDYPVCHTPNQPDYYLHRDFQGKKSSGGTPYLDSSCRLKEPRTNLLIYSHHMKNGSMFAPLLHYTDPGWRQKHPYIQFDTVDSAASYEVAAVLLLNDGGSSFPWQQLLFPDSRAAFDEAWTAARKNCFYSTKINLTFEEELLALVTCEYTQKNGRLMVVARKIS